MPEIPTPGQIAYVAFAVARGLEHELALWALLPPYMRAAWEAAAQAAIAQWWRAHEAVICGEEGEERR